MCGIAGTFGTQPEHGLSVVQHLNEAQGHRGPDDATVVRVGAAVLGNTRLAIQDPGPTGNQPFASGDGRYVCVFNGEIYNYLELIEEYRLQLPSHCDGAVIPALWERLGEQALGVLQGMYALAIYDSHTRRLHLARDPFGIKPLYRARLDSGGWVFGSEPRPLARVARASVSATQIARYLYLGSLAGDASPFDGIEAIPPNTVVTMSESEPELRSPIAKGGFPFSSNRKSTHDDVLGALDRAVETHLRSDVPSALLLSSGVDSSLIARVADRLGHRLHCLTVAGLSDADETTHAKATSERYNHQHEVVRSDGLDDDAVTEFFAAMQRPTIDGLNTFMVCRAVRDAGYKVALSGLGADEAFGGYAHYRALRLLPLLRAADWMRTSTPLSKAVGAVSRSPKAARLVHRGGPRTPWGLDLLQREVHPSRAVQRMTGVDPVSPFQEMNGVGDDALGFREMVHAEIAIYLQSTLLPDADAFSMNSSVELRVPFLDRALFAAAVEIGADKPGKGKTVLTDLVGDPYLQSIAARPKLGFTVPMAAWMDHGPLAPRMRALDDPSAPIWSYVDREAVLLTPDARTPQRWTPTWALGALNGWLMSLANDRVLLND